MLLRLTSCLVIGFLTANAGQLQSAQTDEQQDRFPKVSLDEIASDTRWSRFVPIARQRLDALLRQQAQQKGLPESSISRIEFSSTLSGTALVDGTVSIELPSAVAGQPPMKLPSLGRTNLSNLQVYSAGRPIPLASKPDGVLVALTAPESTTLTGTWNATGSQPGRSVLFELQLPNAAVSVFSVLTDSSTQITSPNAFVYSEAETPDRIIWKFYPNNRTSLTINCSGGSTKVPLETVFVDLSTDIRIAPEKSAATWVFPVTQQLSGCRTDFKFSPSVTVSKVSFSDGTDVKWNVNSGGSQQALEVFLPFISTGKLLTIEAQLESIKNNSLQLPFLQPASFSILNEDHIGTLQLHANTIRMTVAPQIVVNELSLAGVHERSVSYPPDGSYVIEMVQHAAAPNVSVSLASSQAILADAVVVKVTASESEVEATAYVNVTAKTGSAGTVGWTIPTAWRVTEVRELNADSQPLLFSVTPDGSSLRQTVLEATLRTPLLPGANQSFAVKMQSIEGAYVSQRDPAALYTSQYNRKYDYLVTSPGTANPFADGWSTNRISGEDLSKQLSWLPADEFTLTTAYERKRFANESSTLLAEEEIFATVDYSITEDDGVVVEFARIRLRSRGEMPARIPLLITSGIDARVGDESALQPMPSLMRINPSENMDEWMLEIPPGTQATRELDFILNGRRPFVDGMPAMVVMLDGIRRNGGTIQTPDPSFGIQLTMRNEEAESPLTEAVQYPATNFLMNIRRTQIEVSQQIVSGREFVILKKTDNGYAAESICRCLVQSTPDRRNLVLKAQGADVRVFVNGRPAYAETKAKNLQIPLPLNDLLATVDVYVDASDVTDRRDNFQLPVALFPDADSSQIASFVLTEFQLSIADGSEQSEMLTSRPAIEIARLMDDHSPENVHPKLASILKEFRSRWLMKSTETENAVAVGAGVSVDPIVLSMIDTRMQFTIITLWIVGSVFALFLIGEIRPATCGMVLLLLVLLQGLLSDDWQLAMRGMMAGVIVFATCKWSKVFVKQVFGMPAAIQKVLFTGSGILVLLICSQHSVPLLAQENAERPLIVAPDVEGQDFPLLYIDQTLLESLNAVTATDDTMAAVVESNIDVTFESPGSSYARIRLTVATHERADQRLPIPLTGVTLVDCSVDGESVFPTQDQAGQTAIELPMVSILPNRNLGQRISPEAAVGPRQYGDWHLRTVEYTVRIATRIAGSEYRLPVPYPPSPRADVVLIDPSRAILSARIQSQVVSSPAVLAAKQFSFPSIFNDSAVELSIRLDAASGTLNEVSQKAKLLCSVDLDPGGIRSTSTYRVTPADSQSTEVVIGTSPQYRITGVESLAGNSLPWTAGDRNIVVKVLPDSAGEQQLIVRQTADTPVSLSQTIHFEDFARVNGQLLDEAVLQVKTTEQFIVKSILGDGKPLQQLATSTTDREVENSRATERSVAVPATLRIVEVELAERTATRVARLAQTVVVTDDSLDWTCKVEIEISGKPAFRQVLSISEDVRIGEITVTNGGATRLQSWTRSKNLVIVSLREATRGILAIDIKGALRRNKDSDTSLPVIAFFEDVVVLESSLELSANSATKTFISSLAGARPNTPVDMSSPLPKIPVSLTVTDDTLPVLIRASPDRKLTAEIIALLYEVSGQSRMAIALAVDSSDNSSALRFKKRSSDATSPQPIAKRNDERVKLTSDGEIYSIPPPDLRTQDMQSIVIFSDLIPVNRNSALTVQTPEFDSELEVTHCSAYDIRAVNLTSTDVMAPLPKWAVDAFRDLTVVATVQNGRLQPSEFDATTRRVVVRPATRTQSVAKASTKKEALHIECEHAVRSEVDSNLGTSGFLVFVSQPDSILSVRIPEQTTVTQIKVNQVSVPIVIYRGVCRLALPARICHVAVDWLRGEDTTASQMQKIIPLPSAISPLVQNRITVLPPTSNKLWWSLKGPAESDSSYSSSRAASVMTGLRMVEEVDPADKKTKAPESFPPSPAKLSDVAWQQLFIRSPTAAKSLAGFLEQQSEIVVEGARLMNLTQPEITVRSPKKPSMLSIVTVGIAILLIVGSWIGNRGRSTITISLEAQTAVQVSPSHVSLSKSPKPQVATDNDVTEVNSSSVVTSAR